MSSVLLPVLAGTSAEAAAGRLCCVALPFQRDFRTENNKENKMMRSKMKMIVVVMLGVVFLASSAQGILLGGLAGMEDKVIWGDDLIDNGYLEPDYYAGDPWYVPDLLLDGDAWDMRWDMDWGACQPNNVSMTFDVTALVNVTEVSVGFRWWTAAGTMLPLIELYRDAAHTQLVSSVAGSSNEANGSYPRVMAGLDETLNTLYFEFVLPSGITEPYANDLVSLGEVDVTGTVIPEPVSAVVLVLGGGLATLLRRKR